MKIPFIETLIELATTNPKLMLLTADLGFDFFEKFEQQFPDQFLNVGVAEQNMMGVATGLALEGFTVFTYSIGNFATLRCLEQIRNDACYHKANIKIVANGGGFSYGALGMSHHATEDLSIMRALPNISVLAPCNDWEVRASVKAIANSPGVSYLRLDRTSVNQLNALAPSYALGKSQLIKAGEDISLLSIGGILEETLLAHAELAKRGISARLINMGSLKPLDTQAILAAAKETGGIISVEENTIIGGLGSAIAETCMSHGIFPQRFLRLGLPDCYSEIVGNQAYLRAHYQLDAKSLVRKTLDLLHLTENVESVTENPTS